MHMADALLSPEVGVGMWAVSGAALAYSSRRVRQDTEQGTVPLMGVLGAFLFAAQMINFTIPGTGSSGHLGGGLLLTLLLGPHAGLLAVASVLVVQALFFADGGLLALGCNIFNMGVVPAYLVYPLVRRQVLAAAGSRPRLTAVTVLAAILVLQLGPLCVVLQTYVSGISALPLGTFLLFMQPIHLAIGIVEGVVTAGILSFVATARPGIITAAQSRSGGERPLRHVAALFLAGTVAIAGIGSWYASENPDGLEWALTKVTGHAELAATADGVHRALRTVQQATALLPNYGFATPGDERLGTGVAGLAGVLLTLALAGIAGLVLGRRPSS